MSEPSLASEASGSGPPRGEAEAPAALQPGAVPISGAQILTPLGLSLNSPGLALQQVQLWQGQFPPPDAVEHYERLLPGVFDRIVQMAEQQSAASIQGTSEARGLLRDDTSRGQWLGWSIAVLAILGAVLLGMSNHPAVAGALVTVPVMSVALALINGVRSRRNPPQSISAPAPSPPKAPPPQS